MLKITHFVNGQHTPASTRTQDIFEPATGELRGQVSLASETEVGEAIAIAKTAFETWSQVTPLNRARVLFKFKTLVEHRKFSGFGMSVQLGPASTKPIPVA